MVTYYIAQYCITNWSIAKHLRIKNTTDQGSKIINSDLLKINLSKSESKSEFWTFAWKVTNLNRN